MAGKIPRTYRLTSEAIDVIEGRDKSVYPTANDFIERQIIEAKKEQETADILQELKALRSEMQQLRADLLKPQESGGTFPGFSLTTPEI